MPELYSRMDNANWLTPSIADILEQGANPPGGAGTIREYTLILQRELSDLDTPARIVNVRSSPSYHLFVARPEMVGKMGNRHLVTPDEIEKSIEQIAEAHPEWSLGFMPTLRGEDNAVGILLRTRDHRPQSLRRLLVRDTYRKHPTTTAFLCGITLDQQIVMRDLAEIGHVIVIGKDSARNHLIQGILLTLILLNTPGELRLAMAGHTARNHRGLSETPHALGRLLPDAIGGQRLLAGLVKEVQRRYQSFQEENVRSFAQYNEKQQEKQRPQLPRIVMVIDSLSDESWQDSSTEWLPLLGKLAAEGHKAGIHLLLTADDLQATAALDSNVHTRIVLRAAGKDLVKDAGMHRSQIRFIDALLWETRKETRVNPFEICAVSAVEIKRAVEYWRSNARQRQTETATGLNPVSGKTGVTGLLQIQEAAMVLTKPPIPEKPQPRALERATQILSARQPQVLPTQRIVRPAPAKEVSAFDQTIETGTPPDLIPDLVPEDKTVETPITPDMPYTTETHPITDVAVVATQEKMPVEVIVTAAHSANGAAAKLETVESISTQRLSQSQTLAAYLGWLSPGALQDIFLVSQEEATAIIEELKHQQVLEETTAVAPRFLPIHPKPEK